MLKTSNMSIIKRHRAVSACLAVNQYRSALSERTLHDLTVTSQADRALIGTIFNSLAATAAFCIFLPTPALHNLRQQV